MSLIEINPEYEIINEIINNIDKIDIDIVVSYSSIFKFTLEKYIKKTLIKSKLFLDKYLNEDIINNIYNKFYMNNKHLINSNIDISFSTKSSIYLKCCHIESKKLFNIFNEELLENEKLQKKINKQLSINYNNFDCIYYINNDNIINTFIFIYNDTNPDEYFIINIWYKLLNKDLIENITKDNLINYLINNKINYSLSIKNKITHQYVFIKEKYVYNFICYIIKTICKDYNKYFMDIIIKINDYIDTYKN